MASRGELADDADDAQRPAPRVGGPPHNLALPARQLSASLAEASSGRAIVPTNNDVLFGRGRGITAFPGNERLRAMADAKSDEFRRTKKRAYKTAIAQEIYHSIVRSGGRFLMEDPDHENADAAMNEKVWVRVEEDKAVAKIKHRLRERKDKEAPAAGVREKRGEGATVVAEGQKGYFGALAADQSAQHPISNAAAGHAREVAHMSDSGLSFDEVLSRVQAVEHSSEPFDWETPANVLKSDDPLESELLATSEESVEEWVTSTRKLLSENAYALLAADLGWMIAKHIADLMDGDTKVTAQDLAPQNLRISLRRPTLECQGDGGLQTLKGVKFLLEARGNSAEVSLSPDHEPLQSHDACASLGKILLHLFGSGTVLRHDQENAGDGMPPPAKRRQTMPTRDELFLRTDVPRSMCRLICDLLDSANEPRPETALTSLDEAIWELGMMKSEPKSFLIDLTCPAKASELLHKSDELLFGREGELDALMKAKEKIGRFVHTGGDREALSQGNDFLCDAICLRGYAGSGKSSILRWLTQACEGDQFFVISCKFDKQAAPVLAFAKGFDDFFRRWGRLNDNVSEFIPPASMTGAFQRVCRSVFSAFDDEGFGILSELVPSLFQVFPLISPKRSSTNLDKVGSATKRRLHLLSVLFNSLLSAGYPVMLGLDDMQHCNPDMLEYLADLAVSSSGVWDKTCQRGLLMVGTYRIGGEDELIEFIPSFEQKAKVTRIVIGGLEQRDVTKLLSVKLCLPWRYTKELARLVHTKTRGNPFFVVQFVHTIVQNGMLTFSVEQRRWLWDCDVVDMQMISEGVAELIVSWLSELSTHLIQALQIAACIGIQLEERTIKSLDSGNGVLPFAMLDELKLAVEEGIMEKAGPLYQFTHDIIHQTTYDRIPDTSRNLLHRGIGENLMKVAADDSSIYLISVEQIDMYCSKAGVESLSSDERSQYAGYNVAAAKMAISASSFEQARSFIDMGIKLLEPSHWEMQYVLSLELYELAASVSFSQGDTEKMSTFLEAIFSHHKSVDDTLQASALFSKLLASKSQFEDAVNNCLTILDHLGQKLPTNVGLPLVLNELSAIQERLQNVTRYRIGTLAPMANGKNLSAMKFLDLICTYTMQCNPMLLPLAASKMIKLTAESGFCEDSIVGLVTAGYALFTFTDNPINKQLAYRVGKVCEALIEESPNRNALKSRCCLEWYGSVKVLVDATVNLEDTYSDLYNSAKLCGDVQSAVKVHWSYCASGLCLSLNLTSLSVHIQKLMLEAMKYQQESIFYSSMPLLHLCLHLSGESYDGDLVGLELLKEMNELKDIAQRTSNAFLQRQTFFWSMKIHFWGREYLKVAELAENDKPSHHKRVVEIDRPFMEGIAFLRIARDTNQSKWRTLGEKRLAENRSWALVSTYFNCKHELLQAELSYLDGDIKSAENYYNASIESAREQKYICGEALALELYGMFCVENGFRTLGRKQLGDAVGKYEQWGAMKKAADVQRYIDAMNEEGIS